MLALMKHTRRTCFHKLSYCNATLSCKVKVLTWAQIHTLADFIPVLTGPNQPLNSASLLLAQGKMCSLSYEGHSATAAKGPAQKGPLTASSEREYQLAEVQSLLHYSKPRQEGCACKAFSHEQRKQYLGEKSVPFSEVGQLHLEQQIPSNFQLPAN